MDKRKEIFCTYLPPEDWVDRRLFFEEQIDPESDSDEEVENIDKSMRKTKYGLQEKLLNSKNNTISTINDQKIIKDKEERVNAESLEEKFKNLTYN